MASTKQPYTPHPLLTTLDNLAFLHGIACGCGWASALRTDAGEEAFA
jgi:hypothetical protein